MRINKYLSEAGYCSRRKADALIESGLVFINGVKAGLGDQAGENDEVRVGDKTIRLENQKKVYLAYHKPVGVICTADPKSPNNIIQAVKYSERVFPVGRLDVESSGLIFLTNDGDFAQRLTHPKFAHQKEYLVRVDRRLAEDFAASFKKGVKLAEGFAKADQVKVITGNEFLITIHQGWRRQIRRMCSKLGYGVKSLKRIRIGKIDLGDLPAGRWRELKPGEVRGLGG